MTDRGSSARETRALDAPRSAAGVPFATYEAAVGEVAPLLAAPEEDRRLARQLLAMPSLTRVEAAVHDCRFHRVSLARMMALQAEAALFDPAGDARPWAELAAAIGAVLARGSKGGAWRTAALGGWLLGKGLLRSGHRRLAREAFHSMVAVVGEGDSAEEMGLRSAGLAQVHEDMGEVEGATASWLRSAYYLY
jgi:hypothetical protein